MRLRNEAKVGLIVFSGIVALIAIYWFLGGLSLSASTYPIYAIFTNTQKLDKGALVRMAGVKVGVVSDTRLVEGSRARVDMRIWNENRLPRDSVASITTGGFIGDNYVEVIPGKSRKFLKTGERIRTRMQIQPEDLLGDVGEVLHEIKRSTRGINELLGDKKTIGQVKDTIAALKSAAESSCELANAARQVVAAASPKMDKLFADAGAAALLARKTSAEMNSMLVHDVRPNVKPLLEKTSGLVETLNSALEDIQGLMTEYKGSGEGLGKVLASANKVVGTMDEVGVQAKEMMKKLNDASTGIKDLATDPEIKADLKKTIHNAAEASEQAKGLLSTLNDKFGPRPARSPWLKSAVPDYGIAVNALANIQERQSRVDAYYTFLGLGSGNKFYRIGAYNIGESTGLIAQGGLVIDRVNAFRYGIYNSRIGVGYDRHFGQAGLLSMDWYRPNYGQFEVRATMGFGEAFGLYAGVNDLIHAQNRDLLVGIRYLK